MHAAQLLVWHPQRRSFQGNLPLVLSCRCSSTFSWVSGRCVSSKTLTLSETYKNCCTARKQSLADVARYPSCFQHICMFLCLHVTLAVMTHRHVCFVAVTAIIVSGQLILGGSAVITALTGHHLPLLFGCASCMCLCTCVCAIRTAHARHCFSSHDKPNVLLITAVVDRCCYQQICFCDYDWFCLQA